MSDDRVALMTDGQAVDPAALDESLMIVSGLRGKQPTFWELPLVAALSGGYTFNRYLTAMAPDKVVFRVQTPEFEANGALLVVKDFDGPYGPQVVVHSGLPAPIWSYGIIEPAVLDADTMVIPSSGPDLVVGTADDVVLYLANVGDEASFQVTAIPVGAGISRYASLVNGAAVIVTTGADNIRATADDGVVIVQKGPNGPISATHLPGLPLGLWLDGQKPLQVGPDAIVWPTTSGIGLFATQGADPYVLARGIPSSPEFVSLDVIETAQITPWGAPHPVSNGEDYTMHFTAPGPDNFVGTSDDELISVSGLDGNWSRRVENFNMGLGLTFWTKQPVLLEEGYFVTVTTGPDGIFGGSDDGLAVISNLDATHPTLSTVPFGVSLVDVRAGNSRGVWVVPSGGGMTYVTGFGPNEGTGVFYTHIPYQVTPAVAVNDWVMAFTTPGETNVSQNFLNETFTLLQVSYADDLPSPAVNGPTISVQSDPFLGLVPYPVRLAGGRAGEPCGLIISEATKEQPLDGESTLYADIDRLLTVFQTVIDANGNAVWWTQIANDPTISGYTLTVQAAYMDDDAALGYSLSNALELHF